MGYLRRPLARGGRPLDRTRRAGEVPASAARVVVETKRQYNPGWNTPVDL